MGKIYNESKPRVILLTDGPRSRVVIDALMLTKDKKQKRERLTKGRSPEGWMEQKKADPIKVSLLSNMKKISCVRFELDFRGQIFTRRRSIAVAM